eukprot:CAMPEP_0176488648 /NCGR_PEP_ID=MMETSP0200_2-20121128/6830_1 /TAXON_ID=947934 /ORGANISM="Chaetoceros sp., Strain GSL56" /LENGTH=748 /DNA_ID=CAMNT_0017885663 /DNA_START=576 /DNA_END=2822 /DNA_ORIENTATION=+
MNAPTEVMDRGEGLKEWSRLLQDTSFISASECAFDLQLECYLASDTNISCNDYMSRLSSDLSLQCTADVIIEYSITNIGKVEETLENIQTSFNSERPFVSVIDDLSLQARNLLPEKTVISSRRYSFDFCSTSEGSSLLFEIELDCTGGETYISSLNYSFDSIPTSECFVDLDISCETLDGGPCRRPSDTLCTFRPFYFDFLLNGGICAESVNEQDSSKFTCMDHRDISSFTQVFIVVEGKKKTKHYFSGTVSRNEVFTIGIGSKIDSDLRVSIYSQLGGILIQTLQFHSSCSKSLSLGDTFGAITIAGFRDKSHDLTLAKVASGLTSDYNIYYIISNTGQYDIQLEDLVFTSQGNRTIAVVKSGGATIKSADMTSGKVTIFNMSVSDFEISATLSYRTIPLFASKSCLAVDHYEVTGCSDKGSKSQGSKGSGKCVGKGSKSSSKGKKGRGKGKGYPPSKSNKSQLRSKGKGGSSKLPDEIPSSSKKGSYIYHSKTSSSKSVSKENRSSPKAPSDSSSKGSSYLKGKSSKSWNSPSLSKKGSSKDSSDSNSKGSSYSKGKSSKSWNSPSSFKKGSSKDSSDSNSKGSSYSKGKSSKSWNSPSSFKKGSSKDSSDSNSKGSSYSKGKSSKSWNSPSSSTSKASSDSSSKGSSYWKAKPSMSWQSPSSSKKGSKASSGSASKGSSYSKSISSFSKVSGTSGSKGLYPSKVKSSKSKSGKNSGSKNSDSSKKDSPYRKGKGKKKSRTRNIMK